MLSIHLKDENFFNEVARTWDLERLYADLAQIDGKELAATKKRLLCALLHGYSPAEIAQRLYQSSNSASVRVTLSRELYRPLKLLLSQKLGTTPEINWGRVNRFLTEAGYRRM
jgi:hypothetical protein